MDVFWVNVLDILKTLSSGRFGDYLCARWVKETPGAVSIQDVHYAIVFPGIKDFNCRQTSNISGTKPKNLNVSRLVLQLSLPDLLEPSVKWRMKM